MKKTNTLYACAMLIIITLLFACKGSKDPSTLSPSELLDKKRDSILTNLSVSTLDLQREYSISDTDMDGVASLSTAINLFSSIPITRDYCIYVSTIKEKIIEYVDYKPSKPETWGNSMKKMIEKFSPSLSKEEREAIAKSLRAHGELIHDLTKMYDDDLETLLNILDTIAKNQEKNDQWLYSPEAEAIILKEHALLKKVWNDMPELVKGDKGPLHGYYYFLSEIPKPDAIYERGYLWNTRHINKYQYAANIYYRRCLSVNATTSKERMGICIKTAETMKEAADMLTP